MMSYELTVDFELREGSAPGPGPVTVEKLEQPDLVFHALLTYALDKSGICLPPGPHLLLLLYSQQP